MYYFTNDYGEIISGGYKTEKECREGMIQAFKQMWDNGTPVVCPQIVFKA